MCVCKGSVVWDHSPREGVQSSSTAPLLTHLQAGHPDAHRSHEQQVVGQELFQFGDAASL